MGHESQRRFGVAGKTANLGFLCRAAGRDYEAGMGEVLPGARRS